MNTKKLFIENLDASASETEIEDLFSIYGDVAKVKVKKAKGLGFVEMTTVSEAKRVCENLNGEIWWGRSMKILNMNDSFHDRVIYQFSKIFK